MRLSYTDRIDPVSSRLPLLRRSYSGIGSLKFGAPAIAVSPGTDVVREWTGRSGAHNVVAEQGRFDCGAAVDAEDETSAHTFEDSAVYRCLCEPHQNQGMLGAVFVALDGSE